MRTLVLAALVALAASAGPNPLFVSLVPISAPTLTLRSCGKQLYVTERGTGNDADFALEAVDPLDKASGDLSLRSAFSPSLYACIENDTAALVMSSTLTGASCTFRKVQAPGDATVVYLKHESLFVSVGAGAPTGPCAGSLASPDADVVLAAVPFAWALTDASAVKLWAARDTSLSVRHCNFRAYVTKDGDMADDFHFVMERSGKAAVTLRSSNYPGRFLGLDGDSLNVIFGTGRQKDIEFELRQPLNGKEGAISLMHVATGKYLALGLALSGPCGSNYKSPEADAVLISATEDVARASWQVGIVYNTPKTASFKVDFSSPVHTINPLLYGVFFEEINFAGEGGLYAELVRNRDFEALGRGDLGDGKPVSGSANGNDFRPWTSQVVSGTASVGTDSTRHPFDTNPVSLKIESTKASKVVLSNPGYWGINSRVGTVYRGSFYAACTGIATLTFSLKTPSGTDVTTVTALKVSENTWKKHTFELKGVTAEPGAHLSVTIEMAGATDLWLDSVSLIPGDAVAGLFRKDVFDFLYELHPAFVRFPGGNYLEGQNLDTYWNWKKSLGDPAARPGHYNQAWNYWTNDGLGLYEYHILCELLGAEPLMSIFTGYFLSGKYTPLDQCGQFIQDAVDAVEYANGAADTTFYGALRSESGHAAPFNMKMIEVGNEEKLMDEYRTHYIAITSAVWAVYPEMNVIGSGRWGPSVKGNPCTTESHCARWDDHYYRTPDEMAAMGTQYDSYDRNLPKVFVGEYAANNGGGKQSLRAGLAEAVFMIGFERNADVVEQASFAPLFRHVSGTQWAYDLISYNSSSLFGLPAYHVQKLFRAKQGAKTYSSSHSGVTTAVAAGLPSGTKTIKIANYAANPVVVSVVVDGVKDFSGKAMLTVLTAPSSEAVNDLDTPNAVAPYTIQGSPAKQFSLSLPAWSLALFEF